MGSVLSRAARRRSARLQGRQGASTSDSLPENGASQRVASAFVSGIAERMPEEYTRFEAGWSSACAAVVSARYQTGAVRATWRVYPQTCCTCLLHVRKGVMRHLITRVLFLSVLSAQHFAEAVVLDQVSCSIAFHASQRHGSQAAACMYKRCPGSCCVHVLYSLVPLCCRCVWRAAQRVRPGLCGRRVGRGQR